MTFIFKTNSDKNRAPGAAEAFKAVGNAVAILTDAEKRKSYDLYGSDEQQNMNRGGYRYSRGFEADVTAEELFNMFFGGGAFPTQNVYSNRHRRFHRQTQEEREVCIFYPLYNCQRLNVTIDQIVLIFCLFFGNSLATLHSSISYQFCFSSYCRGCLVSSSQTPSIV